MAVFLTWLIITIVMFGVIIFALTKTRGHEPDSDVVFPVLLASLFWPFSIPALALGYTVYGVYKLAVWLAK